MKRILVFLVSAALVAGALYAVPVAAQEAPAVPENPNVVDPANDAGFGTGAVTFKGADILAGWFTHDATTISAHVQTTTAARLESIVIDVGFDPGVGAACMYIDAVTEGAANDARVELYYEDDCGDQGAVPVEEGTFTITEGPDGTAINTITVPRSADPAFADGKTLATPFVNIWNNAADAAPVGRYDTTDPGTDYVITSSEADGEESDEAEEPKKDKKKKDGKKKGCKKAKKGKGKKRGCEGKGKKRPNTGPPTEACAPFTPGEAGAEKPTVELTDEATEEKPVEQTVNLDMSLANLRLVSAVPAAGPLAATVDAFNIQVDSESSEAGLYALLEFPQRRDYDLNLLHPDGSYAARARSFNTGVETPFNNPGHGGEGTDHSEKLVGIKTADCGGWTLSAENHFGEGGEFTIKLWLGEATIDPQEPGKETPS